MEYFEIVIILIALVLCVICVLCVNIVPYYPNTLQKDLDETVLQNLDGIENFFGENIPASPVLIRADLAVNDKGHKCVNRGVDTMFDYSNRFIDEQFDASRIYVLPPYQIGEVTCV